MRFESDLASVAWPFVADRFLRVGAGPGDECWRDLATNTTALVELSRLPHDWQAREARLELDIGQGHGRFIDGGRVGLAGWFVAHAGAGDEVHALDRATCDVVAHVCEQADHGGACGTRVVHVPPPTSDVLALVRAFARPLRVRGYVVVNAMVRASRPLLDRLGHRHVCVVVDRPGANAAKWIRSLTAVSRRAHLVVDLTGGPRMAAGLRIPTVREAVAWPVRGGETGANADVDRARHLLRHCDFDRAEAVLMSSAAERRARGEPQEAELDVVRAEVCFWQGRLEEGVRLAERAMPRVDALIVRGLLAWRAGDVDGIEAMTRAVSRCQQPPGLWLWANSLSLLSSSMASDAKGVAVAARRIAAFPKARCGLPDRIAFLASAAGAIACGQRQYAPRILGPRSYWRRATPLERLALEWIRAVDERKRQAVMARIACGRAFGLREWTTRSHTMQLVQAIPTMLQAVHDAESDLAALGAAGEWMRRECGAAAVAFFAADQPARISASGWTAADTAALLAAAGGQSADASYRGDGGVLFVTASIRYAGVTIGRVAAKGHADRQATLEEAARMVAAVSGAACRTRLDALLSASRSHSAMPEILGRSPAIVALRESIVQAAATPFSVLVEGESGTGKELVARAIHRLSARRDRRFCAVNCAAITDELVEAELFGHARGAFTGAVGLRTGLFEDAHGGTLFLDEVGELSPRAQAKILRALQEREVRRVGENTARPIDVRVIAATNRPLADLAAHAGFREDLLFRLAVIRIRLPPLRDRIEDIPLLAGSCWRTLAAEARKRAVLGADALAALCRHAWPGNVREFQNVVAALVVSAPVRGRVGARHVQHVLMANAVTAREDAVVPLHQLRMTYERRAVAGALAQYRGRRTEAARALGLSRQGLTKAIRRLGLDRPRDVAGVA